jgi:TonB family protein
MRTLIVFKSTHELFAASVRDMLPKWTFVPAERGGRKVKQLVTLPFEFAFDNGETRVDLNVARSRSGELIKASPRGDSTERLPEIVSNPDASQLGFNGLARPVYPADLRAAGKQGQVVARFTIGPDGVPDMHSFTLIKSDAPQFTDAVRNAVTTYRFAPLVVDGQPRSRSVMMPFVFALDQSNGPANREPQRDSVWLKPGSMPSTQLDSRVTRKASDAGATPANQAETQRAISMPAPKLLVHRVSDTIPASSLRTNQPPSYPNQLRAANIEGEVIAQFLVLPDGSVDARSIRILKADHALFEAAAVHVLTDYRFKPATIHGVAAPWLISMPFVFSLSK